jgi:hypothetical protein
MILNPTILTHKTGIQPCKILSPCYEITFKGPFKSGKTSKITLILLQKVCNGNMRLLAEDKIIKQLIIGM